MYSILSECVCVCVSFGEDNPFDQQKQLQELLTRELDVRYVLLEFSMVL